MSKAEIFGLKRIDGIRYWAYVNGSILIYIGILLISSFGQSAGGLNDVLIVGSSFLLVFAIFKFTIQRWRDRGRGGFFNVFLSLITFLWGPLGIFLLGFFPGMKAANQYGEVCDRPGTFIYVMAILPWAGLFAVFVVYWEILRVLFL
jgi:hypothetical protein